MPLKAWTAAGEPPAELRHKLAGLNPVVIQLLHNRGVTRAEEVADFLDAQDRSEPPFRLAGMSEAVTRIRQALKRQEPMAVFGDFDADGVTATVLLVETLTALGGDVRPYIPHRVDEGYGVNGDALRTLACEGVRLVITVDCGIRSTEEVDLGRSLGLDMVVTDHHMPGETLPAAVACINPRRLDSKYPFRELAGVGVAYKLADALLRAAKNDRRPDEQPALKIEDLLDLVALGTIADLMPLLGENRYLVTQGLKRLNVAALAGVRALLEDARVEPGKVTATCVGFALAPRLNAAGRLASAMLSYELLTTTDAGRAQELAAELGRLNRRRQDLTAESVELAQEGLDLAAGCPALLFVSDESYEHGIVGLTASRLTDEYYRPAVVVRREETLSRGSARSIPEFHITKALDRCAAAGLLVRHGGHAAAAGFTVETGRLAELERLLQAIATEQLAGQTLQAALPIDRRLGLHEIDEALMAQLRRFEPCGYCNPEPVFETDGVTIETARTVGSDAKHLKLRVSDGRLGREAIAFGMGDLLVGAPARVDIAYVIEPNEWNGRTTLQLRIKDMRPA